jgi:hypothetical protein
MEGTSTMVLMSVYNGKERVLFPDLAHYSSSSNSDSSHLECHIIAPESAPSAVNCENAFEKV